GLIRSCLGRSSPRSSLLFFFSEPATPEIYTLSLHDALPIWSLAGLCTMIGNLAGSLTNIFFLAMRLPKNEFVGTAAWLYFITNRSEEHTSELQSRENLVCRLLLEKKKKQETNVPIATGTCGS